jgi:hypothetical protein
LVIPPRRHGWAKVIYRDPSLILRAKVVGRVPAAEKRGKM